MKDQRKIKENNLGYSWETRVLIALYRKERSLEINARKFASNFDKLVNEELKGDMKLAKTWFIDNAYEVQKNSSIKYEEHVSSDKAAIQASLYRILKKEGLLEDAIAELTYWINYGGNELNNKIVESYASHLRYYLNHPEIHYEYKLTKRNYVKDIMEVIKPQYDKLISILQRKGHLKETEIKEVEELAKFLKEKDDNFAIRSVILEDFFKSEDGLKLSEEAKIEIALKLGALDKSAIHYYGEDGNLIK